MGDIGRLVGPPAQRLGRQIRRVGLNQQPVERHLARDGAQGLGVLEGDNAGEGDGAAKREPRRASSGPAGEAMQHEGKGAALRLLFEDAGDVVIGLARMDDER